MARKICEKCHRQMEDTNFYTYQNGEKVEICKSCLTMHIDNFDEQSFLWVLEKMDVPYIRQEWNKLRDKAYAKNPQKITGQSVIGKYLSKMKLRQWKEYRWADGPKLQAEAQKKIKAQLEQSKEQEEYIRQQYENGEITEAQYRTLVSTQFQKQHDKPASRDIPDPIGTDNMFNEANFLPQDQIPDLTSELTLEDKQKLVIKWGRTYTVQEWVQLEKTYAEMMNSFDIQDADSKNTLIFLCKTILKMNQAIDCGDVEGYQKLNRIYESQRKSMMVTAAQNKEDKTEFIDSVGQLVAYCEKYGHQIPKFEIETPHDIVDKIITDLKDYNRSLVYEDVALARQIEDYLKNLKAIQDKQRDEKEAKQQGYDTPQLTSEDFMDFKEFVLQETESTNKIMQGSEEE